jgi:hypothetical protein
MLANYVLSLDYVFFLLFKGKRNVPKLNMFPLSLCQDSCMFYSPSMSGNPALNCYSSPEGHYYLFYVPKIKGPFQRGHQENAST